MVIRDQMCIGPSIDMVIKYIYVNMQKILETRAGLDTVPPNLSPSITGLTLEGNQIAYVGNMEMYIR